MSITTCALSGKPLEEPVISTKTGHVFEKRVIEKHIDNTGQCPITGTDLEKKDLMSIKGKLWVINYQFSYSWACEQA